jgi:hypothetical protein
VLLVLFCIAMSLLLWWGLPFAGFVKLLMVLPPVLLSMWLLLWVVARKDERLLNRLGDIAARTQQRR